MKRSGPPQRKTAMRRVQLVRKGPVVVAKGKRPQGRNWLDALAKCQAEGKCRVCGSTLGLQTAHVIGREHDRPRYDEDSVPIGDPDVLYVHPDDVVPLCSMTSMRKAGCHQAYDVGGEGLDLLPFLSHEEQARAVLHVGIIGALRRISGRRAAAGAADG